MGTPSDSSSGTFAAMRQNILQALEQAEDVANQRAAEIIREAEERAKGITREHEQRVSEIEGALLNLRNQVDSVMQQLAQFRNPAAPTTPPTHIEALDMGHPLQPDAVTFRDPAEPAWPSPDPPESLAADEPLDVLDPLQPDAVTPVEDSEALLDVPDPLQPDPVAAPEPVEFAYQRPHLVEPYQPDAEAEPELPEAAPTPWPRTSEEVARELAALANPRPEAEATSADPEGPEETLRALRAALSALHASDPSDAPRSTD